jgi:membrane fusion protein, heavy metal efflux system
MRGACRRGVVFRAVQGICAPIFGVNETVLSGGSHFMVRKMKLAEFGILTACFASVLLLGGCGKGQGDVAAQEAPPPAVVVPGPDAALLVVQHPEQYPLATATAHEAFSTLAVTSTVTPDISRNVPVVSLASGRVVAIHARLGDTVQKDQVLLSIRSDDVAGGFSDYRKAVADELLARKQLDRSQELYTNGAIAMADLEVAQDAEDKAKVDLETMAEHLRLLGNDPDHPNFIVDIKAPVAGVITDQEITNAAAIQAMSTKTTCPTCTSVMPRISP